MYLSDSTSKWERAMDSRVQVNKYLFIMWCRLVFILYCRERVKEMFQHAYNGYLQHAYPLDELCPVTCTGADTWGRYIPQDLVVPVIIVTIAGSLLH